MNGKAKVAVNLAHEGAKWTYRIVLLQFIMKLLEMTEDQNPFLDHIFQWMAGGN